MKVIGKVESDIYLCQVSHAEIEKFLNLYFNKMDRLKVGEVKKQPPDLTAGEFNRSE